MKKIRTALLSFGMSGRVFHAPFITEHPGFEFAGAWERSKKSLVEHYPEATSYPTLESVLQDEAITLVIVNTPTNSHYELTKKSLEAGKHVVVEKAFTTTVAEAEELKTLAEAMDRKLSVYQNRRWDSDFRTVQHIIHKGILGNPVEVSFSYDRFNPALSPKLHKEIPGPGAGVVYDLGPHLIDQAFVLFGKPLAVFASFDVLRATSQVEDYFELLLYYPKLHVRLRASYFVREPAPSFIVHGTRGSFLKTRGDVQEATLQAGRKPTGADWGAELDQDRGILHTEINGTVVKEVVESLPGNYMAYYEGVYQSIANNQPPPVTADDGIMVMRIIEAAFRSDREKKVIELP
jgi:scyllo-inositol 2-dehydrogenase (NADP+)